MTTVLTFHRITNDNFLEFEDISSENFEYILSKINQKCVSIDQILSSKLSDNWLLSFDDGFSSDFEIVLPLMNKFGIKGIFFITTSYVGKKNYLNWNQIKTLSNEGMEIGSHSVNHLDMLSLSKEERLQEIVDSKKFIEKKINKEIKTFSFPFGRCNKELISEVLSSGYQYCFTSKPGRLNLNENIVPRISINGSMSKNRLDKIINKNIINYYNTVIYYNLRELAKHMLGIEYYWKLRRVLNSNF